MRCFSFYLTNLTNLLNFLFPFLIKIPSKCLPVQIENMVALVSRTGRHLQRYEKGYRLVVGCIPYRYKKSQEPTSVEDLEVLVISAQNGQGMLFPKVLILCCLHQQARYHHLVFKITVFSHFFIFLTNSLLYIEQGGWENDECMEEAAKRETEEEAGVIGVVQDKLGPWHYKSKRSCIMHESYMFPLLVKKELDCWPEKNIRKRRWVSINEAREVCHNWWMREALEELFRQQSRNLQAQS
ncbi:nudix hydrolase 4 isoform X1 [Populus trichocarpa]|uniref:nudix hydrolase 4 isoform X1 n=1 Tax=Populus trichocarpa TaxID=3694 RepID=UPI000CCD721C|nr:nudix hydrolase 4 isoform X1 [Populus trichocarpa]